MNPKSKEFDELCQAVAAGDPNAVVRFRSNLLPYLRVIVRRALRSTPDVPAVRGRIRSAAEKLQPTEASKFGRGEESCVGQLARRVCELLVQVVQTSRGGLPKETILGLLNPRTMLADSMWAEGSS
jgi:hypothetical protein